MNTEAQAKELWCPMVRYASTNAGSFNRGPSIENPPNKEAAGAPLGMLDKYTCNCIASKCSMWRWVGSDKTRPVEMIRESASGVRRVVFEQVPAEPTTGYCGLAGSPT